MLNSNVDSTASFEVDPQCCFTPICPAELPIVDGDNIVWALHQQAKFARLRLVSRDAHSLQAKWIADDQHPQFTPILGEPNLDVYWNAHAIVGSRGFDLIPGLDPDHYQFQVYKGIEVDKHPYGACYHDFAEKQSTGALEFLVANHIKRVIVGGLATDYCVKITALQLCRAGFEVVVHLAACRGIARNTTNQALLELQEAGVKVVENIL
ncbi:MAG: isochorismatase family protein [Gammaproteobacteria bacterium]|nr:isochorismatase family protein [Gammaproteobacteria bacterium]